MSLALSILYRGPLSSCNYGCAYCPFAKRAETPDELAVDRDALARFVAWVSARPAGDELAVFFTPWGEALVRPWYQDALAGLSRLPHVKRVAIQTNLSCRLDWLDRCDASRVGLWTTYHPGEVRRDRFVAKCRELAARGVRFSVGIVGTREHAGEARALRDEVPAGVYVWVNAYKREIGYYTPDEVAAFEAIDPLFRINLTNHRSLGASCRAGRSVVSVEGDGTMRRCHFVQEPIGNLYDPGFERALVERPCTNAVCRCHIGYVHMDALGLGEVFGDGILERVPRDWPDRARLVQLRRARA